MRVKKYTHLIENIFHEFKIVKSLRIWQIKILLLHFLKEGQLALLTFTMWMYCWTPRVEPLHSITTQSRLDLLLISNYCIHCLCLLNWWHCNPVFEINKVQEYMKPMKWSANGRWIVHMCTNVSFIPRRPGKIIFRTNVSLADLGGRVTGVAPPPLLVENLPNRQFLGWSQVPAFQTESWRRQISQKRPQPPPPPPLF